MQTGPEALPAGLEPSGANASQVSWPELLCLPYKSFLMKSTLL